MSNSVILEGNLQIELDDLTTEQLEQLRKYTASALLKRKEEENALPVLKTGWYIEDTSWNQEMYKEYMEQEHPGYKHYADDIYRLLAYVEFEITIEPDIEQVWISKVNGVPFNG